jgi:hypothetical protein
VTGETVMGVSYSGGDAAKSRKIESKESWGSNIWVGHYRSERGCFAVSRNHSFGRPLERVSYLWTWSVLYVRLPLVLQSSWMHNGLRYKISRIPKVICCYS